MDKEALSRLVESGDPDAILGWRQCLGRLPIPGSQSASALLETLRSKQADIKIQAADLSTFNSDAFLPQADSAEQSIERD